MRPEQIIIKQIVTEKAVAERAQSRYVFSVNLKATKVDVAQAVESLFKVDVISVNTSWVRGKRRVAGTSIGRTAARKKAYVRLKTGQKIEELET
ncbi:MAG: 50S ribosomal protein L23 [bacterium]